MNRKLLVFLLSVVMVLSLLTGCGNSGEGGSSGGQNGGGDGTDGKLVVAIFSSTNAAAYDELDLIGRFKEKYPEANIEIETFKDDSAYWEAMQIRASAGELPDIMFQKPFTISQYAEYLYDITEFAGDSSLSEAYKYDGQILAIPTMSSGEYVYYWEDMLEEAGVKIPDTWDDFIDAAVKTQEYFEKDNSNFMALALGGKDEWTTYPYVEYMANLENGNGHNWSDMAAQDEPFSEGTDIYTAYHKINKLFTSGAFGKDPLGIGFDQAATLFGQKQAAMIAASSAQYATITESVASTDSLKAFYLPTRDSESDPFRVITQGDNMISITKDSKNVELAKSFVEFYLSDEWYPEFVDFMTVNSTLDSVEAELNPALDSAKERQPEVEWVVYDGGNDDYTAISSEVNFNYKKLGCEMFVDGFDLDKRFEELNASWKAAREKLGIE